MAEDTSLAFDMQPGTEIEAFGEATLNGLSAFNLSTSGSHFPSQLRSWIPEPVQLPAASCGSLRLPAAPCSLQVPTSAARPSSGSQRGMWFTWLILDSKLAGSRFFANSRFDISTVRTGVGVGDHSSRWLSIRSRSVDGADLADV